METTQLFSSTKYFRQPFSLNPPRRQSHPTVAAKARRGGERRENWGNIVDENMIVLRKRIKEMKISETGNVGDGDEVLTADWMEWEKHYYLNYYNEDVCEAMGLLQNYFLNIRPSLGLGTLALVIFSVLISSGVVLSSVLEIAMGMVSRLSS